MLNNHKVNAPESGFQKKEKKHILMFALIIIVCLLFVVASIGIYNAYYFEYITDQPTMNKLVDEIQEVSVSSSEFNTELNGTVYMLRNHKCVYVAEYKADKNDKVGINIVFPRELVVVRKFTNYPEEIVSKRGIKSGYIGAFIGDAGKSIIIKPSIWNMDASGFIVIEFKIPPSVYRQGEITINTYVCDDGQEITFLNK